MMHRRRGEGAHGGSATMGEGDIGNRIELEARKDGRTEHGQEEVEEVRKGGVKEGQ